MNRNSVADAGSGVFFTPWIRDPDPGWIFSWSRIRPLFLLKFLYIISRIFVMLSLCNWATFKTSSWKCKQQEKGKFSLAASLFTMDVGSEIRDEKILWKNLSSRRPNCFNEYRFRHRHLTIPGIDCFLGSFCYIRTVFRLNCLSAQLTYEGRAAVEGGK
jgi:hypothetical protein